MIFYPEVGITPEAVRTASEAAFADQQSYGTYTTDRTKDEYNSYVPKLDGKSMSKNIEHAIHNSGRPIRVLDIGAGEARMLRYWSKQFGDRFQGYAITAKDFRFKTPKPLADRFCGPIDYKVANAYDIDTIYPEGFFDYIVSVQCFRYLADPLGLLEKVLNHLPVGGKAFVHNPAMTLTVEEENALKTFFEQSGFPAELRRFSKPNPQNPGEFSWYDIAAERQNPHPISLPFRYLPPSRLSAQHQYRYELVRG